MEDVPLSPAEREALARIELVLTAMDPTLGHRLRTVSWTRPPGRRGHRLLLTAATCVLLMLSAALLVSAAVLSAPALIGAFAASYALAVAGFVCLVVRWCRRPFDGASEPGTQDRIRHSSA